MRGEGGYGGGIVGGGGKKEAVVDGLGVLGGMRWKSKRWGGVMWLGGGRG